jgi:hypothetical protein
MDRAIGRNPSPTTIATHKLVLRLRAWCACRRRRRAVSRCIQRVNDLANQLQVRADTRIDKNESKTGEYGDNEVLQSASSFIAASVVTACAEIRRVVRTTARLGIARAAARLRFLCSSIETAGRQTTSMDCFFEDAGDLLRESAMFGCGAATQRLLQMIRNVRTDKDPFSISHLSSPSLALSGLPCNFGTGL